MTDRGPDDGSTDPERTTDGLEARGASDASPAPVDGRLPSASSIFGEAKLPDNWPTRREMRAAQRAAESGEVEPFVPEVPSPTSAPEPSPTTDPEPDVPGAPTAPDAPTAPPEAPTAPHLPSIPDPFTPPAPPTMSADEDDRTQAISMPEELAKRSGPDIPSPAAVPPAASAPHPMSIELPFAASSRASRAAETREVDEERRRTDPDGLGRDDVDWLGRATGSASQSESPTPQGPESQPIGVAGSLPPSTDAPTFDEPPSFTELLRIASTEDDTTTPAASAPFDWTADAGPAPTEPEPAEQSFDTTSLAVGSWSLADEDDAEAEVVDDEVPADPSQEPSLEELLGVAGPADAVPTDEDDDEDWDEDIVAVPVPDELDADPVTVDTPTTSWSLSDEAARTGELFVGDTMDDPAPSGLAPDSPAVASPGPAAPADADSAPTTPVAEAPDDEPRAAEDVPWWAQPDATPGAQTPGAQTPGAQAPVAQSATSSAAVPPLVDPEPDAAQHEHPGGHLPPAVGQDLDALLGTRRPDDADPATGPTPDQQDVDQQEWDGRETSDTRAIDALFGTGAMQSVEHDYLDDDDEDDEPADGTRMMPVVGGPPVGTSQDARRPDGFPFAAPPVSSGPAPADSRPVQPPRSTTTYGAARPVSSGNDNFVNEGFGRLAAQGPRGKRLFIWGAVVIIVVLLVAVFFLTRWIVGGDPQDQPAPAPTKTSASASFQRTATPEPAPSATAEFATAAAGAGEHSWRQLAGGECVAPFTDAWARTFTVVDCAAEHAAQLTVRGTIDQADYPGADTLKAQMSTTCSSSSALNLAAAGNYTDIQVQGSYPADLDEWNSGDHYYYCFVSRSSGQAITGSLAPAA